MKQDRPLDMVSWETLRGFGKSRVFQSSYFWIGFVPVAAKFFQHLESPIQLMFGGKTHHFALALPFSWYLFYFSSVAFAIASLLFAICCPKMVKSYKSFREFFDASNGVIQLRDLLREVKESLRVHPEWKKLSDALTLALANSREQDALKLYRDEITQNADGCLKALFATITHVKREELVDVFHITFQLHNYSRPWAKAATSFFYGVGFILLAIVLYQGFASVVRFALGA